MSSSILASIVLPTHGRRASLLRVLQALGHQSVPGDSYEVIVVCDGDVDGSADACHSLASTLPYKLTVLVQYNQGPAAARNHGVATAVAPLIVFIDDDVVPDENFITAHLAAQLGQAMRVTIGPLLPPLDYRLSPWGVWEERTLCRQYDALSKGRWQPTYRQFYTGNASVLKRHIEEAGGFDTTYRRAEDVELALRLRDRGLHFVFLPEARAWHYVERSYESWLRMSTAYGAADIAMARAGRPEVLEFVPRAFRRRNRAVRILTQLCADRPLLSQMVTSLLTGLIKVSAVTRFALLGNFACSLVFNLRYYDGLVGALGSRKAFKELLQGKPVQGILEETS